MQDSYGDCGFNVDVPTLPVARAIPSSRVSELRAEGKGEEQKGLQADKPATQGAELPVTTLAFFCVLGG